MPKHECIWILVHGASPPPQSESESDFPQILAFIWICCISRENRAAALVFLSTSKEFKVPLISSSSSSSHQLGQGPGSFLGFFTFEVNTGAQNDVSSVKKRPKCSLEKAAALGGALIKLWLYSARFRSDCRCLKTGNAAQTRFVLFYKSNNKFLLKTVLQIYELTWAL